MDLIDKNKHQIIHICQKHDVEMLYLFGSILRKDFTNESDVDVLVRFKSNSYQGAFNRLMDFKHDLEILFERSVDITVERQFRNSIFQQEIERTRRMIYAA